MSTLWPPSLRFFNIFWSSSNFPDARIRALPSYMPFGIFGASWKQREWGWERKLLEYIVTLVLSCVHQKLTHSSQMDTMHSTAHTKQHYPMHFLSACLLELFFLIQSLLPPPLCMDHKITPTSQKNKDTGKGEDFQFTRLTQRKTEKIEE